MNDVHCAALSLPFYDIHGLVSALALLTNGRMRRGRFKDATRRLVTMTSLSAAFSFRSPDAASSLLLLSVGLLADTALL